MTTLSMRLQLPGVVQIRNVAITIAHLELQCQRCLGLLSRASPFPAAKTVIVHNGYPQCRAPDD